MFKAYSGAGVKDGQYSYLMFFVELLDAIINSIGKLLALFKKEEATATPETTTEAPAEDTEG